MLDAPADALAGHLLTLLPPEQPRPRTDLARLPLPVAHYLSSVLDRRLAREAALPDAGWFDGDAAAVQQAARAWRAATHDTARFPASAWELAVRDATRRVLAFLVEPAEALTDLVFADSEAALSVEAVRARMAAFSPYLYLREIAEGYFGRKTMEAVGREEFERLLRRIDRRMVSLFGPHDWLALLEPLFDLLRPLPDGPHVPASLLRRFFEAKGYDDLARTLDAAHYDAPALRAALVAALPDLDEAPEPDSESTGLPFGAEALTDEFVSTSDPSDTEAEEPVEEAPVEEADAEPTVEAWNEEAETPAESALTAEADEPWEDGNEPAEEVGEPWEEAGWEGEAFEDEPFEDEPEPEPEPTFMLSSSHPSPLPPPAASPAPERSDEEPLWMQLARSRDEEIAIPPSLAQPAADSPPRYSGEPEPLWKRFAGDAPASTEGPVTSGRPSAPAGAARPPEPLARLETRVLGPSATERRNWYITHLTAGSEAEYRAVLEQLGAAPNWTEATQIIGREVFRKHRVNIYSDAALAFTDAVEARFRS